MNALFLAGVGPIAAQPDCQSLLRGDAFCRLGKGTAAPKATARARPMHAVNQRVPTHKFPNNDKHPKNPKYRMYYVWHNKQ